MSRVVFYHVVECRVVEFVVQSYVLTGGQWLVVGCVMNGFPFPLASLQIYVMLDMRRLSGVAVRVMIRAEGNTQDLGQIRRLR